MFFFIVQWERRFLDYHNIVIILLFLRCVRDSPQEKLPWTSAFLRSKTVLFEGLPSSLSRRKISESSISPFPLQHYSHTVLPTWRLSSYSYSAPFLTLQFTSLLFFKPQRLGVSIFSPFTVPTILFVSGLILSIISTSQVSEGRVILSSPTYQTRYPVSPIETPEVYLDMSFVTFLYLTFLPFSRLGSLLKP